MWYRMLRSNILPGLSMVRAQSILAVDIWNILKNYDTYQRWQLYAEWNSPSYGSHPTFEFRSKEVNREVKNLLRRLSHENIEKHIMTITKIAHSNPCILFRIIVSQVQAYDNMVPELVKVLSRVTILPLDVLTFSLVNAFSQPDKEHVKDDGISITDWLTSEQHCSHFLLAFHDLILNKASQCSLRACSVLIPDWSCPRCFATF
jgi:THO complex subunit 2